MNLSLAREGVQRKAVFIRSYLADIAIVLKLDVFNVVIKYKSSFIVSVLIKNRDGNRGIEELALAFSDFNNLHTGQLHNRHGIVHNLQRFFNMYMLSYFSTIVGYRD